MQATVPEQNSAFSAHFADFETTTSNLLRMPEALALLNFAALFHETIYVTDTAVGDHGLIITSFQQNPYSGLFRHLRDLIEARIVKVLARDRVAVGEKVLVPREPMISDIYEGWVFRDKNAWHGETGFTTLVDDSVRRAYNREVDDLLARYNAIRRYDPDVPKRAFRQHIRDLLNRENGSILARSVGSLPEEKQRQYRDVLENNWFTNAELWRVLKDLKERAQQTIIFHVKW